MSSFFITGSGTDVGKTYIAKEIIARFFSLNKNINAIKPIISGFNKKEILNSDTGILLKALKKKQSKKNINDISPWRYSLPLAPDIAARSEKKKSIVFTELLNFCRNQIIKAKNNKQTLLIEGVGGIMCPINKKKTILDLINKLDIPVIFITRSYLGSISHTLTAIDVLKKNNIKINCIIVNQESRKSHPSMLTETGYSIFDHSTDIPIYPFLFREKALPEQIDKILNEM